MDKQDDDKATELKARSKGEEDFVKMHKVQSLMLGSRTRSYI